MDNYETGIYTDNPDDTLRYMQTTQPVDLWGYPKQEQDLVEVVRCKECKCMHIYEDGTWWCEELEREIIDPFWFCANGERRRE